MTPAIDRIDHLHVHVSDRRAATAWYGRVLGLQVVPELAHWAADGGPLTLADTGHHLHLALFERPPQPQPCRSTVALGVGAAAFVAWREHLGQCLGAVPAVEDHGLSQSLYFSDPDGNPYEITCADVAALRGASAPAINHCADQ